MLLWLLLLLPGCAHDVYGPSPARVEPPAGQVTFDDCELGDGSSVPSDFPRGALAPPGPTERALSCGLSAQLAALGEPSLFPAPPGGEVYRVLWLRGDGHPVSVRLERQGAAAQVRGAQASVRSASAPGELLEESSGMAPAETLRELLGRVEAARFWAQTPLPSDVVPAERSSTWVFEGVRNGRYQVRVFQREALARDAAYSSLGRALIGASGLHIQGAVY